MNPERIAVGVVLTLIVVLIGVAIFRSEDTLAAPGSKGATAAPVLDTPPPFPANPPQPVVVNYDEIARGSYRTRQPPALREAESRPVVLPKTSIYEVRSGDTYARIAKRLLGSSAQAGKIAALNPDVNDRALRIGMKLVVPAAKQKSTPPPPVKKTAQKKSSSTAGPRS